MTGQRITDNLDAMLGVLPPATARRLGELDRSDELLEIILDLGRVPTARFLDREEVLSEVEIKHEDIEYVVKRIGDFDADNRAGMERTLHRIAAIRNRRGHIVGLTCRVGRAVYGTTDIIQDLIESGKSLLILGRPGVGKTTMLREAARLLAEKKRVVIVDTSNEIGGDGDVPHPAVGRARRMQVATPNLQHEVMIEAVENHNPEAIVIDEIGRELEAAAARTIAERGVQLIGTAHGNTLENLLLNPTLSDLVGGIESVTLSDEEARRRGTQKTVLERRSPPTFDVLIEIQTRDRLAVHTDVAGSVDALLRGYPLPPELRSRDAGGEIRIEKAPAQPSPGFSNQGYRRNFGEQPAERTRPGREARPQPAPVGQPPAPAAENGSNAPRTPLQPVRIYAYGVARNRLAQASKRLGVPAIPVNDVGEANVLVTLRSYYRDRQRPIVDAENRGLPIYVLRANTISQMQQFLSDLFSLSVDAPPDERGVEPALQSTQAAIDAVLNGERWVELPPASAYIRRLQHQMARQSNLTSHSYGKEPYRRVRIFRD
ncbi:MAG TPA: R3H domain-containing nucleic acid-binding protein [Anaerolineales bacterium]|nr:R3H domain-containing nucleic acid-binding protein [Anaerolineales bacterium]